jgi:hypothetical protein
MVAGRKSKSTRRAKQKNAKTVKKRAKAARKSSPRRTTRKTKTKKQPSSKRVRRATLEERAVSKLVTPNELMIVDTLEEPIPGVVVLTETEYEVR